MAEKKTGKKSFATLAEDLREVRARHKPTAKQIEELNSLFEERRNKTSDARKKKIARSPEREA